MNMNVQTQMIRMASIESSLQQRYIDALKQYRRTKSNRDKEVFDLVKDILCKEFEYDIDYFVNLNKRSLV